MKIVRESVEPGDARLLKRFEDGGRNDVGRLNERIVVFFVLHYDPCLEENGEMSKQCDRMDAAFLVDLAECEKTPSLEAANDVLATRMCIALEERYVFL